MGKNGLCTLKMHISELLMNVAGLRTDFAGLQIGSASLKVSIAGLAMDYVQVIFTIAKLRPVLLPLVLCRAVLF